MSVEQIGFYEIPNDPVARKKLLDGLDEIGKAMTRIKSENTYIAESLKELKEQFDISTTDLRKAATDRTNGTYKKTIETSEKYQDLYSSLFPNDVPKDVPKDHE